MKFYEKPSVTFENMFANDAFAEEPSYLGSVDPLAGFGEEISIPAGSGTYWE